MTESGFQSENGLDPEARIGERVRAARRRAGLSQTALAERVGVSQPAVAAWENGVHDPRRLAIARIADALDVSAAWLSSGRRSEAERDKHPAAAYLRRPLVHTPVIGMADAPRLLTEANIGPHRFAEDYIPVSTNGDRLFAVFSDEPDMAGAFPLNTLVVVDYADRQPASGAYCLAIVDGAARLRRWRDAPGRLETLPPTPGAPETTISGRDAIIGCVRVSIRFH